MISGAKMISLVVLLISCSSSLEI